MGEQAVRKIAILYPHVFSLAFLNSVVRSIAFNPDHAFIASASRVPGTQLGLDVGISKDE